MKKRFFSMLLALLAAAILCAVSVSAADLDFSAPAACAHCKTTVTWLPLTQTVADGWAGNYDPAAGTHYYLSEKTVTLSKGISVAAGEELCLHLNGNTLKRDGARAFAISGKLVIMDHAANKGQITGQGDRTSTGCVLRLGAKNAQIDMYGGNVNFEGTGFAGNGGCVYMAASTVFNLHHGAISGGRASTGGNVFVGENAVFTMTDGTIQNGTTVATAPGTNITVTDQYGANVYIASKGAFIMSGGTVTGGNSSTSGGNIGILGTFTMTGGTVSGGESAKSGGNLYLATGATATVSGGTVTGGEATDRGGNVYMAATSCTFTMTGGTVSDGTSVNNGGNLYLNNGQATISGGTVTGGSAGGNGGNISANVGANRETNWLKLTGGTVTGGTAAKSGGNIYVTGIMVLGNAAITGGTAQSGSDVYMAAAGKLTVQQDFAGEAKIGFDEAHLPSPIRGGMLAETLDTCEGPFPGKLHVENDPAEPVLYGKSGDTKLYVAAAALVKTDGTTAWYPDNAAMMAAYQGDVDHICAAAGDLTLPDGEYLVDLCGQNVTVTGTGSATFFDSANADYKTYGTAAVTGVTVKNSPKTTVKGSEYYTVQEGSTYSFHLLSVQLNNVNIRPSSAGIYYDGIWGCDEKMAEAMVDTFGVAVSTKKMPGSNFATDSTVLKTAYTPAQMESGAVKTGVIIKDILAADQSADENDTAGRVPVYARAYLKLTDGTVVMSDTGAAESLYSVMTRLDTLLTQDSKNFRRFRPAAKAFYETWKEDGMGTWELPNISAADDGVIDVLMIGNSFCYYFVEELEAMARAAGVSMRVCNVYYGGCTLDQHYTWWKNDESNYKFYVTQDGVRKGTTDVSLEWCLEQGDWDVISLQQVSSGMLSKSAEDHLAETATIRKELYDYLKTQFPAADFYWHQIWSYQLGYDRSGFQMDTTEKQQLIADRNRDFAIGVCEENGVKRINTGEAWQIYRKNYVGTDGLTDTLCARLSSNSGAGDNYHDGDTGGGQYLNACVWFEVLTGKDCRETTYRPTYTYSSNTYTLSETLVGALQQSAHQAVLDLRAWEAEQST